MSDKETTRQDVLNLIDSFVEQIHRIRKILLGVSISSVILAPLALGLSIYLIIHPSFFSILDTEEDFGDVLGILLGAVIVISSIWLVTGIRQYGSVKFLNKKYQQYIKEKDEIDRKIASQYGLDQD
ncbi:MAG: hypothetical protein HZA82_07560 [Thaumarchaeota archaeon]|nr:hypothetical protein [Nitrososphaerota archaeon]